MSKGQKSKRTKTPNNSLYLSPINPLNKTQKKVFTAFPNVDHLVLHGSAGTGKTFLALYLALDALQSPSAIQDKIVIVRSAVASRDVGFLPGTLEEKTEIFELPYVGLTNALYQRGDAWEIVKKKKIVEVMTTSYARGITIDDAFIIIDEVQNMTFDEIDTIVTRVGEGSRLIICGDIKQNDLGGKVKKEVSGFNKFMNILPYLNKHVIQDIQFTSEDIVRSGWVKDYIIAKEQLDY